MIGTGRCPMASLTQLMSSGTLVPTSNSQLSQTQDNTTHVLGGSFMVFTCAAGLTNVGGSLNVTCLATNAWSTAPNCVSTSGGGGGGGSIVTTTAASQPGGSGGRCPVTSTTFTIANGFISNATNMLIFPDTSSASGRDLRCILPSSMALCTYLGWLLFSCVTGFALDPAVGGNFSCNNGVWSTQPRCISKILDVNSHLAPAMCLWKRYWPVPDISTDPIDFNRFSHTDKFHAIVSDARQYDPCSRRIVCCFDMRARSDQCGWESQLDVPGE